MSATQLPNGYKSFGPKANCTLEVCPLGASLLRYQPSIPVNGTFIGLFALAMFIHTFQGLRSRNWGFMASMIGGCLLEIIGYVGRLILHDNPFSFGGFLLQIICIAVAPVFFCAAIYVTLSKVIINVDRSISRFHPSLFYYIFIPCDIVSLVLQATGGALSTVGNNKTQVQKGVNVSLAGLIFQVACLVAFCALFADYLITCARKPEARQRMTKRMQTFVAFLFLSSLLILVRCSYRIEELKEGYFSEMFRNEPLFICLESSVMVVAVFCLVIGNPAIGFSRRGNAESVTEGTFEHLRSRQDSIPMASVDRKGSLAGPSSV